MRHFVRIMLPIILSIQFKFIVILLCIFVFLLGMSLVFITTFMLKESVQKQYTYSYTRTHVWTQTLGIFVNDKISLGFGHISFVIT